LQNKCGRKQMAIRLTISLIFLLTQLCSNGQVSLPIKAFQKHLQTCHFVGTTEEDFIIVLYSDSTITATKYTSSYRDQYNSVLRQVYTGTYKSANNIIKVIFTAHNSETKSKTKKISSANYANWTDTIVQYPSSTYVINENGISPDNSFFPILSSCTVANIIQLDSTFNNWDKNIVYKKEVFGLSKQ
jgi:hypothetical protein